MNRRNLLVSICTLLAVCVSIPAVPAQEGQDQRGKAELKSPHGTISLDYGRPALKGRDMLAKLKVGEFWRLGKNEVTLISTPADLVFGTKQLPKGTYSLWLRRTASDKFELFFNRQTTGHGMNHDAAKDVASVPMTRGALQIPVELLTIQLMPAPKGGALTVEWGNSRLNADFAFRGAK